jgi:hypothetical protein
MVYVVERYLPGLSRSDLLRTLAALERTTEELRGEGPAVRYLGSTIVIGDEACFCQFEGPSEADIAEANRRAGVSFDRIVPAVTVRPTERGTLMNVDTTTVSMPVRLRRSWPYVAVAAALAAVATAAVLLIGSGTSTTESTSSPSVAAPSPPAQGYAEAIASLTPKQIAAAFGTSGLGGAGLGPQGKQGEERVSGLASLTPKQIAAAFGTGSVGDQGRGSGMKRVKELSSLTPEEIAAAFGTGR